MINSLFIMLLKMTLLLTTVSLCLLISACAYSKQSTFISLVQQGDAVAVEKLLNKRFIKLEERVDNGDTALLIAARAGDMVLFDLLVKYGANINVLAANDRDILNLSVRISQPNLAKHALKAGISTHTFTPSYQGSALIFAAAEGEVEIVEALISAQAPLNRRNNLGWTALLEAVILGDGSARYQKIVSLLLDAGADKNIKDKLGQSPLAHAKKKGYKEIIELLTKEH
ncbi:MAG: ankyrin repeat domain-containing protein [Cellvibrionaceae bacterium]